jgi:LmbE family N-acetylglucosaminyl deacetylase
MTRFVVAILVLLAWASQASAATTVIFSPHQDDETISMGLALAKATYEGNPVVVVLVMDGEGSWTINAVNDRINPDITLDQFGAARVREMKAGLEHYGEISFVHYGKYHDGTLTDEQAVGVIEHFNDLYPNGTFWTTSSFDNHPDHSAMGRALTSVAVERGLGRRAMEAVQSTRWSEGLAPYWLIPGSSGRVKVRGAVGEYRYWNPAQLRYSIGKFSASDLLEIAYSDTRTQWHYADPTTIPKAKRKG